MRAPSEIANNATTGLASRLAKQRRMQPLFDAASLAAARAMMESAAALLSENGARSALRVLKSDPASQGVQEQILHAGAQQAFTYRSQSMRDFSPVSPKRHEAWSRFMGALIDEGLDLSRPLFRIGQSSYAFESAPRPATLLEFAICARDKSAQDWALARGLSLGPQGRITRSPNSVGFLALADPDIQPLSALLAAGWRAPSHYQDDDGRAVGLFERALLGREPDIGRSLLVGRELDGRALNAGIARVALLTGSSALPKRLADNDAHLIQWLAHAAGGTPHARKYGMGLSDLRHKGARAALAALAPIWAPRPEMFSHEDLAPARPVIAGLERDWLASQLSATETPSLALGARKPRL